MITIFRNVREVTTPYFISLENAIERIKNGNSKELIKQVRAEQDKKKQSDLKANLPSILFSGDFPNRKKDAIPKTHSGFIILDIDELHDKTLDDVKQLLCSDTYMYCVFISPSGTGLKALAKIPADSKRHTGYFLGIESYLQNKYGIELDPSGKNIGRVCYESFDPDIFVNENSEVFKTYIEPIQKTVPKISNIDIFTVKCENKIIERLEKWWHQNFNFSSGRNTAIYQLASALNRYGIAEGAALRHCYQYEDNSRANDPFTAREIETIIKGVYRNQSNQHGTEVFEDNKKRNSIIDSIIGKELEEAAEYLAEQDGFQDFSPTDLENIANDLQDVAKKKKNQRAFWYYDDGKLKIDVHALVTFINELGFYLYYPANVPNSYYFIKEENRVLRPVDEREIKEAVLNFVLEKKQNVVYNLLSDRVKYWTKAFLNSLPVLNPDILRDTREISYIPTPTGVYKITSESVVKIDYIDLQEGYVWESQITKNDFKYLHGGSNGDFRKFIDCVGGERAERLKSIIGYLLHNYKDPAQSRAVIIYDINLSQVDGEPEGGSGKSLIFEGLKRLRDVAPIHGDRVDFNKSFLFQEITESTQVAWIDELPKKTDMKKFFSRVTNGLPIEKKNMTPIFIENEDAPKFGITTNFKPKGVSGSHKRRRIDFGVTNYFNHENTPTLLFGKSFFTEWSEQDYNEFFTFYLDCLKIFLEKGIIEANDENDHKLTLYSELGEDFVSFWYEDEVLNTSTKAGIISYQANYNKFLTDSGLTASEFSSKKYLQSIRKMLTLEKITYSEQGSRSNRKFIIHGN